MAAHLTATGLRTTPDQVLVTTGVSQVLALAAQTYLRRRSVVVVESPGWPGCFDVFRAAGARLAGMPLDQDGIRVDGLARAFAPARRRLGGADRLMSPGAGTPLNCGNRRAL
ncbi:aminotransferase class I/II-fold pyridoxal phosphate-dependent enzyme [Spirillospora sp. NPDC048911]|uniref:aminotransferase class I/II-fold pyridoxal phosphate-dependent enzyme n=1 Tax=Spirillospora sp. NPDC048911 TaxID=3364527 RepID=UPI0037233440